MGAKRERIFVFARTGIGDIVYTIPALRALRKRFPDAHITIEAGERGHSLLRYCPYVDEVWVRIRPRGLRGKLRSIWNLYKGRFDRAVILDRSDEKTLHTFLARIPERYGVRKKLFGRLLTASVEWDPEAHDMNDHFRRVVELLGCDTSDWKLELFPDPKAYQSLPEKLAQAGWRGERPLVGINPGASSPERQWLPERYAEVADVLQRDGARVVLLGSAGEVGLAEAILHHMHTEPLVLTGKLTLDELIVAISGLDVLISGDTGPAHLAAAVDTPVVGLYGATPAHRYGPVGERHIVIDRYGQSGMLAISACEVLAGVYRLLQGLTS
ncbi:MAG: glycosyltransferase family 9 protein [Armatimonadota bacterium]|nr:glycosyltransferase family 9 protein [Armatimonadota bacterium]